jgi:hypothetical protein
MEPNWKLSWKEQLIRNYAHDFRDSEMDEITLAGVLTNFCNEVIGSMIEEIPDYKSATGIYLREKEQLKAKWLGKD